MTARGERRQSLADKLRAQAPADASAAKAAVETVTLMNRVMQESGMTRNDLAQELSITPGRVSQVLNGDGNVRVSTLSRFLWAAGYDLQISATDRSAPAPTARARRRGEKTGYLSMKKVTSADEEGLRTHDVFELSETHPVNRVDEKYTYVINLETGGTEPGPEPVVREEPMPHGMRPEAGERNAEV